MEDDIYSEREQAKREPVPYQYDEIPEGLRHQIFYVLGDIARTLSYVEAFVQGWREEWAGIWDIYCRKNQVPPEENDARAAKTKCRQIISGKDMKATFDIIEIAFGLMAKHDFPQNGLKTKTKELNNYFRKASFGYQLESNKMMRSDSEYLHSEAVVPTLEFLQDDGFESASEEFLTAHEHYQYGRYDDCITKATAAFESVMKLICERRRWKYGTGRTDDLVEALSKKGFIPNYLKSYFRLGLPPLRHKQSSAHGRGSAEEPHDYMAGYALHLAAANILFLIKLDKSSRAE